MRKQGNDIPARSGRPGSRCQAAPLSLPAIALGRFVDVSHEVVEGMETYRPLPTPVVEVINNYDASVYDGKSEFLIASLHLCGNTGTYVDSPRHRFRAGVDLAGLPLERLADLPVVVADATGAERAIGPGDLPLGDVRGKAVLVRTDFSRHWGTDSYFSENPYLTADACEALVEAGVGFRRDRLVEHRRHRRQVSAGAHDPAGRRRPDLRAHDQPGRGRVRSRAPPRGADRLGWRRHVPRTRVHRQRAIAARIQPTLTTSHATFPSTGASERHAAGSWGSPWKTASTLFPSGSMTNAA